VNESDSTDFSQGSPGLTAAVYYLRPFDRDKLLPALASLGLFVQEQRGEQARPATPVPGVDLSIVVAGAADVEAVRELARQTPVLLALVDAPGAVSAQLEAGAGLCAVDDEVLAPASKVLAEAARMARRYRRNRTTRAHPASPPTVELGGAVFSSQACALVCGGTRVALSRAERDVLTLLAAEPGTPVRSEVLASAAHIRTFPTSRYLASVIVSLRRKLRRLGADSGALATVHGVGYVLFASDRSEEAGP
jgi:DNA-binding response OmpR family regulator